MERWLNRVAVVTGASSGIGAACCSDLVAKGRIVVGLARREARLLELKASLPAEQAARFHARVCDVSVEQQVIDAIAWVDQTLGGADVLINIAGFVRLPNITDKGNTDDLRATLDTNVMAVSWCTHEVLQSLQRRKVNDGPVVIINWWATRYLCTASACMLRPNTSSLRSPTCCAGSSSRARKQKLR